MDGFSGGIEADTAGEEAAGEAGKGAFDDGSPFASAGGSTEAPSDSDIPKEGVALTTAAEEAMGLIAGKEAPDTAFTCDCKAGPELIEKEITENSEAACEDATTGLTCAGFAEAEERGTPRPALPCGTGTPAVPPTDELADDIINSS